MYMHINILPVYLKYLINLSRPCSICSSITSVNPKICHGTWKLKVLVMKTK